MKLTTQYSRVSMLITVIILVLGGLAYYLVMSYITNLQLDRDLTEEFSERVEFIRQHQRLPKPYEFDNYAAKFERIGKQSRPAVFIDTTLLRPNGSKIAARAVITTVSLKNENYRMVIIEPKDAAWEMMQLILVVTFSLITVLLLTLFLANRFVLNRLWQPFYALVSRLKSFSLSGEQGSHQPDMGIDEFRTLQDAIDVMAEKSIEEYKNLKVFTENASHEMMTPIALITSKLDSLIQDESLTEAQLQKLQTIYNAGHRLSRLNQSLLLLVKIDNQLITDSAVVDLMLSIQDKVRQMTEIIEENQITVSTVLTKREIMASPYLIDILLNNLLGNAVRHNIPGGNISVILNQQSLEIINTGSTASLDGIKIFERFEKSPASEGTGLGLTIAKNICNGYGFTLTYAFNEPNLHQFTVRF